MNFSTGVDLCSQHRIGIQNISVPPDVSVVRFRCSCSRVAPAQTLTWGTAHQLCPPGRDNSISAQDGEPLGSSSAFQMFLTTLSFVRLHAWGCVVSSKQQGLPCGYYPKPGKTYSFLQLVKAIEFFFKVSGVFLGLLEICSFFYAS